MELDRNKVAFISCVNDEDMYSECLLYLKSLHIPDGITVEYIPIRNACSMCAGYNEGARKTKARYKIYLHQDVLIVNKNIIADLLAIFEDRTVGLVGMIGCRSLPRSGVWWDGLRTYGRVLHHCEPESVVDSHCMEPDEAYIDVEAVDGLLLATQYDLPWRDDLFTGWHLFSCRRPQPGGGLLVYSLPAREAASTGIQTISEDISARIWSGTASRGLSKISGKEVFVYAGSAAEGRTCGRGKDQLAETCHKIL